MKSISSICKNPILPVTAQCMFVPLKARQFAGQVEIVYSLHNTSDIEAVLPFVCFPEGVLQVVPSMGWTASNFLSESGRKMTRFVPEFARTLAAGKTARPCSVQLPYALSRGGSVAITKWTIKPLSELQDLRVFIITGAGNFATERSSIVVPVDDIRAAVRLGFSPISTHSAVA